MGKVLAMTFLSYAEAVKDPAEFAPATAPVSTLTGPTALSRGLLLSAATAHRYAGSLYVAFRREPHLAFPAPSIHLSRAT